MEALIHHFKLVTEGFRVPRRPGLRRRSSRRAASSACTSSPTAAPARTGCTSATRRSPTCRPPPAMCEGGMVADVIVGDRLHRPRDGRSRPMTQAQRPSGSTTRRYARAAARSSARYPQAALGAAADAAPRAVRGGLRQPATASRSAPSILGLTAAEVAAVATFYTMYKRRPVGDYHVGVCTNTLCAVMGGDAIFERLKEHLGVGNDETTADGTVTLEHLECNAACDYAPVMMVNWEFFDNHDARVGDASWSTTCAPATRSAPPAAPRAVHVARGRAGARRLPRRPRRRGPGRRARRRWSACELAARERLARAAQPERDGRRLRPTARPPRRPPTGGDDDR